MKCPHFPLVAVLLLIPVVNVAAREIPVEARGFAGEGLHLFPLGWSSEGRWGALIGRSGAAAQGVMTLAIIDAVTDEILYESEDNRWGGPAAMAEFWEENGASMIRIIENYDLELNRYPDVRDAKFMVGGAKYTMTVEHDSPDAAYSVRITSNTGGAKEVYRAPAGAALRGSRLLGLFISPFESRALAVIREEPIGPTAEVRYRFSGAHLTTGFSYRGSTGPVAVSAGNLLSAVFNGQEYLVKRRLAAGADPDLRDKRGYPALLVAARLGHWGIAAALLAAGAKPNPRDGDGRTALHHAAFAGSAEAVEALLAAGADPGILDAAGRSPRDLAAESSIRALLR